MGDALDVALQIFHGRGVGDAHVMIGAEGLAGDHRQSLIG